MRKEIRLTDKEKGIVQITTNDERWYAKPSKDVITGLPIYKYVPSVTWITGFYPAGIAYYKWLASKGWDESVAIMEAAGNKGTKVHLAIADILLAKEVRIDSKYPNRNGDMEELTVEEIECIQSFIDWRNEIEKTNDLETIVFEVSVFSDKHNYAGSLDFIVKMTTKDTKEETYWLIDFKTSQYIWPSHEIQISAYRETIMNGENTFKKLPAGVDIKLAILQVGYKANKKHYKFTEIKPQFNLFLAAQEIWKNECESQHPKQRDYNIILSPAKQEIAVKEDLTT